MADLTLAQREVLTAIVDTAVPVLDRADDPTGYWARPGSAVGADEALAQFLALAPEADQAGIIGLLDGLASLGFAHQGRAAREALLGVMMALAPEAAGAVQTLRSGACMFAHSLTGPDGLNPFWAEYGYPGPQLTPRDEGSPITPYVPADGEVIEADVVIVGSGAGGGTIAGVLAAQGRSVVVLEAGGVRAERDHRQLEREAAAETMYRGGLSVSADGNIGLLAGATLGGGTAVNWQNCVDPSPAMRAEWATEHGLDGLDTEDFDAHLAAVLERMGANADCSDLNGPNQRIMDGAAALGWTALLAVRNVDKDRYDPVAAGYTQFGDPSGSKRGTLQTYLRDAAEHGARILVHTRADEVCTEGAAAQAVAATWTDPATGEQRHVLVRAAAVVVACGALETPALLLRSGVGGPAVGQHLRLHPSAGMFGVYDEEQRAHWGPPQAAILDEFRDLDGDGYGLLVEGSQYYTGVFAFQLARRDGREHKEIMSRLDHISDLLFVLREHGGGQVTIDDTGESVVTYSLTDERDVAGFRKAYRVLAELHVAAGAQQLVFGTDTPIWRRGEDLEEWLAVLDQRPIGVGGLFMGSAHQMGSARMGTDPATSVCDPHGQVHDVPGLWIGDTSAFPTASGANPMLTCMALAHRTAGFLDASLVPARELSTSGAQA